MRGPIAMRKILDILRLHFSSQFSNQIIADSLRLSKGTVFNCLQRFQHANLSWPLPDTVTHKELTKLLYPPKVIGNTETFTPDFERILEELKRPHVTLRT